MPVTLSLQALFDAQNTALTTAINAARDNVKADNTTQITNQNTSLTTAINAARDNVKADNVTQITAQTTAINSNTDAKTAAAKGAVKSVQRGVASAAGAITIAAVNPANSFVVASVSGTNVFGGGGQVNQSVLGRARLTNATTLQIDLTAGYAVINWEVVELTQGV